MDVDELQSRLEENGEIMVRVSDFEEALELHLHDTEFTEETVKLDLSDGNIEFDVDEVVATWKHYHSLADYGLG